MPTLTETNLNDRYQFSADVPAPSFEWHAADNEILGLFTRYAEMRYNKRDRVSGNFIERLFYMLSLKSGWDGESSVPVQTGTVLSALRAATEALADARDGMIDIAPTSDGDLWLEWQTDDGSERDRLIAAQPLVVGAQLPRTLIESDWNQSADYHVVGRLDDR